jgi:hypothetical protein
MTVAFTGIARAIESVIQALKVFPYSFRPTRQISQLNQAELLHARRKPVSWTAVPYRYWSRVASFPPLLLPRAQKESRRSLVSNAPRRAAFRDNERYRGLGKDLTTQCCVSVLYKNDTRTSGPSWLSASLDTAQ